MGTPPPNKRTSTPIDPLIVEEPSRKRTQRSEDLDGPLSPSAAEPERFALPSSSRNQGLSFASTDGARCLSKYDTSYRYKPPNYVVTDVPDLWSNSKIQVTEDESPQSPAAVVEHQPSETTSVQVEDAATKKELNDSKDEDEPFSPLTFEEWKARRSTTTSARTLTADENKESTSQRGSISFNASDMQNLHTVERRARKLGDRLGSLAKDETDSAPVMEPLVLLPPPVKKVTQALPIQISDDLSLEELHSVAKKKKTGGLFGNFVVDTSTLISPKRALQEPARPSIVFNINLSKPLLGAPEPAVKAVLSQSPGLSSPTKVELSMTESDNAISSTTDETFAISAYDIIKETSPTPPRKKTALTKEERKTSKSRKKKKASAEREKESKSSKKAKSKKSSSSVKDAKSVKSSASVKSSKSKKDGEKGSSKKKKVVKDKTKKKVVNDEDIEEGEIPVKEERRSASKKKSVHGDNDRSSRSGRSSSREPAGTRSRSENNGRSRSRGDDFQYRRRDSPDRTYRRPLSSEERFLENRRPRDARSDRGFSPDMPRGPRSNRSFSPELRKTSLSERGFSPEARKASWSERGLSPEPRRDARSNRGFSPEVRRDTGPTRSFFADMRRRDYRQVSPPASLCSQPVRRNSPDFDSRSSFDRCHSPDRAWPSSRSTEGYAGRRPSSGRSCSPERMSPDFELENLPRWRSSADCDRELSPNRRQRTNAEWEQAVPPERRRLGSSNRSVSPTRSTHSSDRERNSPEWNKVVQEKMKNSRGSSPASSSIMNDEVFKIPEIPKAKKSKDAKEEPEAKPENMVEDILDLIEKHLTREDGQIVTEIGLEASDSDEDEAGSISNMAIFGKKPLIHKKSEKIEINLKYYEKKKQKEREKERARSERADSKKRSSRSSSRTKDKDSPVRIPTPRRIRQRSLSPVGTMRRRSLDRASNARGRRSISPSISIASRRRALSPETRKRAHRASSYDTIASSMIDKKALREIAYKNSIEMRRQGKIPPMYTMTAEERAMYRSGGRSLDDLTAFCKRMAQKERAKKGDGGDDDDDRSSVASELPIVNHPFLVKDRPLAFEIPIDIRGCRNLSLRTGNAQTGTLRQLFPVSTGSAHRHLTWQRVEEDAVAEMRPRELNARDKDGSRSKDKDVEEGPENEPLTLEKQLRTALPAPDYRIPVSFSDKLRLLKFQRQLASDPHNPEILTQMQDTQQAMLEWANQFQYRGDGGFTGEVVVAKVPLHGPGEKQAWARRDQLMNLAPVGGKGQYLLQKMGWVHGRAIGLRQTGQLEPLKMEVKMNKRGLVAEEEKRGAQVIFHPGVKTVAYGGCAQVHPCSALNEACTKKGWGTPRFEEIVEHTQSASHRKTFGFKVTINNVTYKPTVSGTSKKLAKAEVAKWCLEALGIIDKPKEKENPPPVAAAPVPF
ncbi:hypothetical protein RvY_10610 [Ramazzottius varieornatus]|uniref:G-patch domain-containing protein n=1 Tax=Ramazzottius varieornatus TaxID=947166 RepID=A0A1D1VHT6_RAMVA|nr:hypothetical protein RvY_10610 [Ramazzottius varieornatus]